MSDFGERDALIRFVESLRQAAASARIIAHYRSDTNWLKICNVVEAVIAKATTYMQRRTQ